MSNPRPVSTTPTAGPTAHTGLPHPDGKKPAHAFDTPCFLPHAESAGEGWRFLEHGERIEYGDMTSSGGTFKKPEWIPCEASVGRIVADTQKFRTKRRPLHAALPFALTVRALHGKTRELYFIANNGDTVACETHGGKYSPQREVIIAHLHPTEKEPSSGEWSGDTDVVAAYIVHACNTLPALTRQAAALREALGDAKAMLDKLGAFEGMQQVGKTTRYSRIVAAIKSYDEQH